MTSVEPSEGPGTGGTVVTITGTHLKEATSVKFGETDATSFEVHSGTSVTAVAPIGAGTVDVTVSTTEGPSERSSADQFTYVPVGPAPAIKRMTPRKGPEEGGTVVAITGSNFTGAFAVKFGGVPAKTFEVNPTGTGITVTAPTGAGLVDVTVTTVGGQSALSKKDRFRYKPPKRH